MQIIGGYEFIYPGESAIEACCEGAVWTLRIHVTVILLVMQRSPQSLRIIGYIILLIMNRRTSND